VVPPSENSPMLVTKLDSSNARKSAAFAIWSGWATAARTQLHFRQLDVTTPANRTRLGGSCSRRRSELKARSGGVFQVLVQPPDDGMQRSRDEYVRREP